MSTSLRRLAVAESPHELQRLRHHRFHFQQVRFEFLAQVRVLQHFGAQSHARQRRLEVVRHGGEEARPFVDEPDEAGLHGVEGVSGAADLGRAALRQRRAIDVAPEFVGGGSEHVAAGA